MRVDNLSNYTSDRLSEIIEQRFGQKVELDTLDAGSLRSKVQLLPTHSEVP